MKIDLIAASVAEGAGANGESASGRVAAANEVDVRLFEAMLHDPAASPSALNPVERGAESMRSVYSSWRDDWVRLGEKVDITDQRSAVRLLEQQAKLSSQTVQLQFALQSADNVRHAFKSLTQQQA